MNAKSPWVAAVKNLFHEQDLPAIFKQEVCDYMVTVHNLNNSLWIAITCSHGTQVILRPAYAPNDHLQIGKVVRHKDGIDIDLSASIGHYRVKVRFPDTDKALIRYTTNFKAKVPVLIRCCLLSYRQISKPGWQRGVDRSFGRGKFVKCLRAIWDLYLFS